MEHHGHATLVVAMSGPGPVNALGGSRAAGPATFVVAKPGHLRDGRRRASLGSLTRASIVLAITASFARAHADELTKPAAAPSPPASAQASPTSVTPTTTATKKASDDDGEVRLSLPTEADRTAWQNSGFRLGLGVVYGQLMGLRGAPSGALLGATVRVGLRLDEHWSIVTSFEYAQAKSPRGLSGLRFAGTLDPTWHVTPSFSLAVGFGFGGIVEGRTGRMDADPLPSTIDTSYTFPDARTPIASCSGVGAAGLARAEWAYVLGVRTQTSVSLELIGQWTGCVDDTNRIESDTGTAIVRRQWWPHTGFTLGWGIAWR
jgi:hypothetical protein